jgi:energy-coupling factor transporter ATP-binding protein EcfA2
VHVKNYHGIAQTCIEDIPVDTQWIFLTGENGYGKTTFLQAVAIGFLGDKDGDNILVDNPETRISIEFKYNSQDTIRHLGVPFPPMTYLAAYGSARLEIQNAQSQSRLEEHMAISYSLFNTDGVLQNIEFELYKWYLKGDKKFNAVKKLFKQLIPQLHDIKVDKERDEVLYIEQDAHGKAFEAVPFRKLASGFRSIIAMIGDMIIRLYKQQPEVVNPKKLSGIVLIDEFDLHLHPKWQRDLPLLLSKAFPLVQFIVSTHSVIPFLGAPPNSVFLKVTRDLKKGIQVEKLDIDIKNLLPNTILTSAIFDMDNITQRNNEDLAKVRTEDSFDEVLENDEIRERLKLFEESDDDFPTDLFKKA